jgi:tetratricopeptide (TPR) repeat protein
VSGLGKAVELFMAGRLDEARRACRKALQAKADLAEAHVLLAQIHRQLGDEPRRLEALARVQKLRPEWSEANAELLIADLYSDFGRGADAEDAYRRALALRPDLADARFNLAALLSAQGRIAECTMELQALLVHDPAARDAREQLVRQLQDLRDWDAVVAASRAGAVQHPADPLFPEKLGVALWWKGAHQEAIEAYRRATQLAVPGSPAFHSARFHEASALLTLGRFAEGWPAYASRPSRIAARARHPEIVAEPRELSEGRRIRIYSEQGLGDELFFLRFVPALLGRGHRLSLVCEPKLARFLADQPAMFDEVNATHHAPADVCVASGDLPVVSGQVMAPPLPLRVNEAKADALRERLRGFGPPPYLGVTWRAGVLAEEQRNADMRIWTKAVPPEGLAASLAPVNARVVLVQRKPAADEVQRFVGSLARDVLDLTAANEDLSEMLGVLSLLDDYVGVSNTNMHLRAGLTGGSAKVLVLMPAEWRWLAGGAESPWFPGFSLYRQEVGGNWALALADLRQRLTQLYVAPQ